MGLQANGIAYTYIEDAVFKVRMEHVKKNNGEGGGGFSEQIERQALVSNSVKSFSDIKQNRPLNSI
jgi:hypothetical protein